MRTSVVKTHGPLLLHEQRLGFPFDLGGHRRVLVHEETDLPAAGGTAVHVFPSLLRQGFALFVQVFLQELKILVQGEAAMVSAEDPKVVLLDRLQSLRGEPDLGHVVYIVSVDGVPIAVGVELVVDGNGGVGVVGVGDAGVRIVGFGLFDHAHQPLRVDGDVHRVFVETVIEAFGERGDEAGYPTRLDEPVVPLSPDGATGMVDDVHGHVAQLGVADDAAKLLQVVTEEGISVFMVACGVRLVFGKVASLRRVRSG